MRTSLSYTTTSCTCSGHTFCNLTQQAAYLRPLYKLQIIFYPSNQSLPCSRLRHKLSPIYVLYLIISNYKLFHNLHNVHKLFRCSRFLLYNVANASLVLHSLYFVACCCGEVITHANLSWSSWVRRSSSSLCFHVRSITQKRNIPLIIKMG